MNAERRAARLQAVTAALSRAVTVDDIATVILEVGFAAVPDVRMGMIAVTSSDGKSLEVLRWLNVRSDVRERYRRIPLNGDTPASSVVMSRQPAWFGDRASYVAAYPELAGRTTADIADIQAIAVLPLVSGDRALGVVTMTFAAPQAFGEDQREHLLAFVHLCAQALERARLYEVERASVRRFRLLSEVGQVFAAQALNVADLEQRLVHLLTEHLGGGCNLSLLSDDPAFLDAVALDHSQPDALMLLLSIPEVRRQRVIGTLQQVLSTGVSVFLPDADPESFKARASPAYLEYLTRFPIHSFIVVPVRLSGESLGVLVMSRHDTAMSFTQDDLTLLEDVADRVALAVVNARSLRAAERERARLVEADARKNEFLAMLAHELRNPLAPIQLAVQMLRGPQGAQRAEHMLEILERQTGQLTRLVDDLLDVARITRGRVELRKEPVALATLVSRALDAVRDSLTRREHVVEVDLPEEPLVVQGDPVRLEQVLVNLLTNAARYTPEGGTVRVAASGTAHSVQVTVQDNGIGIAPELLPRVFDLFEQGERSLARKEGGLGLGLTIVKSLVELHGGEVRAESVGHGGGSRFTVTLPRLGGYIPAPAVVARARTGQSPRKILVVDDNADAAELLSRLLVEWGHEVATAADGESALVTAERFQPELALLDIGLPGMDGYELARRLRSDELVHGPLVAVTGYGQSRDFQRSRDAGIAHHLVKPVTVESLEHVLELTAPRSS